MRKPLTPNQVRVLRWLRTFGDLAIDDIADGLGIRPANARCVCETLEARRLVEIRGDYVAGRAGACITLPAAPAPV